MPSQLFSEAYLEAVASAPADSGSLIFHTLEISHPEVKDGGGNVVPLRFVSAVEDINAMLELGAPYNSGETVTFLAGQFTITPQSVGEDRTPTLGFSLPNTDKDLTNYIEIAMLHSRWMHVIYRVYLQANLGVGPEMDPPLALPVRSLTMNDTTITISAAADNLVNRKFPGLTYNAQTHPGLVR